MTSETPAELLQQLLDACKEGDTGARRLAQQTEVETLRSFLQESARQYRRAADDIRMACAAGAPQSDRRDGRTAARPHDVDEDDVLAAWERTECHALTYFRDAYDSALPAPLDDAVKRHFEAGVRRLERLRKLQAR